MLKKSPSKKIQEKPLDPQPRVPVTDEEIKALKNRTLKDERFTTEEFDLILRKAAQDVHAFIDKNKKGPVEYLAEKTGVSVSAINSYFFTAYGIFEKDLAGKMHPYVAFTLGLVHAINIGSILGELKGDNGHTTDSSKK
jgi:hypothetical protein